jgi:hypothetical protein
MPTNFTRSMIRTFSSGRLLQAKPVSFRASPPEVAQGRLSEQNLEIAVRSLRNDGLVVVENAIDTKLLDKLNTKVVADAVYLQSRGKDSPFNYNQGNLQQDAPPVKEHFHCEIFLSTCSPTSTILIHHAAVFVDRAIRPNCDTNNVGRSRSSPKADVLLRQLGDAANRRLSTPKTASTLRCRFFSSRSFVRLGGKRWSHRHEA